MLIRVAGPGLVQLGVPTALPDPELRLFSGAGVIASNDDWQSGGDAAAIATAAHDVGAFAFLDGSADSAVLVTLNPGAYTVHGLTKTGAAAGVVLVEVYDASPAPATARLVNVSTRAFAGRGDATVIPGLIVEGDEGPVLLRAVGPGLEGLGVARFLRDPAMALFDGGTGIASNDSWTLDASADAAALMMARTGAFALGNGSADAALRVMLRGGRYTMHATPAGEFDGRGVVLVEVYLP